MRWYVSAAGAGSCGDIAVRVVVSGNEIEGSTSVHLLVYAYDGSGYFAVYNSNAGWSRNGSSQYGIALGCTEAGLVGISVVM